MLGRAKTSPESAASNKLSTRQPPAPIFLFDLDHRTWPAPDCHIHGLYGHEKPNFQAWKVLQKYVNPESLGKVMEPFHNHVYNRIMFN